MRQLSDSVHVAHGGGDAAFGHHRVRFAEKRFADDADARALSESFDGRAQSRAAGADDQHIVFVGFVFIDLASSEDSECPRNAPDETRRT